MNQPDRTIDAVDAAVAVWGDRPGPLLPVLHAVQEQLGWLPDTALARIAKGLNRSRAEIHGVVSFYHGFRREPPPRRRVQVCQAESCQALGGEGLTRLAEQETGAPLGGRSADGEYGLEPAQCLGLCACSPAVTIDGRPHGRVSPERLIALLGDDQ